MELMQVKVDDVYPDESNPRQDFGDIEALAGSFDLNPERPGEPFIPPILVRDGGIYRIVDGERRYRALVARGARRFWANVCDGMDEADSVTAMMATDDKKALTDLERSRGVQKMLLLGVDPVKVDKAGRMTGAERVKRAMGVVHDAAEDMTIDRLFAIEEFADDPDAVRLLSESSEGEWRWRASSLREKRRRAERIEAFAEVARAHGVDVVSGDMEPEGYEMHVSCRTPEDLDEELDGIDPELGLPKVRIDLRPGADVMTPRREDEDDEDEDDEDEREKLERAKKAADLHAALGEVRASAHEWVDGLSASGSSSLKINKVAKLANVGKLVRDNFIEQIGDQWHGVDFDEWQSTEGAALSAYDVAIGFHRAERAISAFDSHDCLTVVTGFKAPSNEYYANKARRALDVLEALDQDGFPGRSADAFQLTLASFRAYMQEGDDGEDGSDG